MIQKHIQFTMIGVFDLWNLHLIFSNEEKSNEPDSHMTTLQVDVCLAFKELPT